MKREHSLDSFAARLLGVVHAFSDRTALAGAPWDFDFNAFALELARLQFEQNPVYRKLFAARGMAPVDLENWRAIPAVSTSSFKEAELSCIPAADRSMVFLSSGTTGQRPSRHFHHQRSLEVYDAALGSAFQIAAGKSIEFKGTVCVSLTPSKPDAPNSSLVHMFDSWRQRFGFAEFTFTGDLAEDRSWVVDVKKTIGAFQGAIARKQPTLVVGTAFSFVHLLDYLEGNRIALSLPSGSLVLETGGYKGQSRAMPKTELHSLIENRLGVPRSKMICEYGMSELSSQAYEWAEPGFHFPPWVRVQIISPETGREVPEGQTGLLRIFDLANVYSVLAIQTEDLAVRRRNGFSLVGRAAQSEPRGCSLMATR